MSKPVEPGPPPLPEAPPPPDRRRWLWLLPILVAALLLLFRPWNLLSHKTPVRIAVARFDNQTADPDFDRFTDGLTDAVIGELTGLGEDRYAVIGNASILRQPRNQRDLLAIHSALKADLVVLGEVQRGSGGIQVFVQLIGLPEQSHLRATRVRSAESDPLRAQAELAKLIQNAVSARIKARAPASK
jgi:TolB-like protein